MSVLIKHFVMPKGCIYANDKDETEYCPMLNHDDVPFCQYIENEPEAAIGIDERPVYCPLEECPEPCEDAVSRQTIFDTAAEYEKQLCEILGDENELVEVVDILKHRLIALPWLIALPSAQPEIIHCKECKYGVQDEDKRWYCRGLGCQVGEADGSGFCADAERRTKDEDTL